MKYKIRKAGMYRLGSGLRPWESIVVVELHEPFNIETDGNSKRWLVYSGGRYEILETIE